MTRIIRTALFWTLILSACSSGGLSPESPPLADNTPASIPSADSTTESPTAVTIPISTTEVLPPPKLLATVSTPHIDQGPDGAVTIPPSSPQDCGYQWAYQDIPELSSEFLQSVQALQPGSQALAFGFGENCMHADGTATFLPMETDFDVTIPLSDLSDPGLLGEWIVKIMQVIENIPPDQIIGPRPGRVSIIFEEHGENTGASFYIDQYHALDPGLSNAEIYQALQTPQ
jgi:hypothetical protein